MSCKASQPSSSSSIETALPSEKLVTLTSKTGYYIRSICAYPSDAGFSLLMCSGTGIYAVNDVGEIRLSKDPLQSMDVSSFTFADGRTETVIAGILRSENILRFYKMEAGNNLVAISAGDIPSTVDMVTDVSLLRKEEKLSAYVVGQRGQMELWNLKDPGWGQIDGTVMHTHASPGAGQFLRLNGNVLLGSSKSIGIWSTEILSNKIGSFKEWQIPKKMKDQKITIAGIAHLPENIAFVAFSNAEFRKFNMENLQPQKTIYRLKNESGENLQPELLYYVSPNTWANFPEGCLLALCKEGDSYVIRKIDVTKLMSDK